MNNFEKIKAMNIDEMADWLIEQEKDCEGCGYKNDCCNDCFVTMKQWLESEVRE